MSMFEYLINAIKNKTLTFFLLNHTYIFLIRRWEVIEPIYVSGIAKIVLRV